MSPVTRRALLSGAAASLTGLLAACGEDDDSGDMEPTDTPQPFESSPVPTAEPIASPVAGFLDPVRWQGRSVVVATAGAGDYLDALTSAFFEPFAEATGAKVRHEQFGRDGISSLIDQVENEDRVWDVALVPTEEILGLASKPYLEAIDYAVGDNTALYPELCMQHGVGAEIYSTVQVYASAAAAPPQDWKTFWDLSQFAGTRALRKSPVGTLEFALLADGVAMADLYPLDTERAFAKLEQIREATLFYEDSKQPVELVRTDQVGLASAWNVRTILPDVASLVGIQWHGGMLAADSWAILRGAENTDVAMSFLAFATRAVPTANFAQLQPFGPVNKDALSLLPPSILASIPNTPERLAEQFFMNFSYWKERRDSLEAQFQEWWLNPPATPVAKSD
jgi:putative spermidine/putrescine transport system substrate-binding protein